MCVYCVHTGAMEVRRGFQITLELELQSIVKHHCGWRELNLRPLQEHPVALVPEPTLQYLGLLLNVQSSLEGQGEEKLKASWITVTWL